jgi:hypothetical protein
MNSIMKFLLANWLLRGWMLFANSTTIITDLTTAITNLSTTQQGRAVNPSFPIQDLTANLKLCVLKFQEAAAILNYILYGSLAGAGSGNVEGGTAALLQTGDSNAASTTTLAINVLNDLS